MRISMAIVLIAMGAIIGATAMYLYTEVSDGPELLAKRTAMPTPVPTSFPEAAPSPTTAAVPVMPTHTPTARPREPEPLVKHAVGPTSTVPSEPDPTPTGMPAVVSPNHTPTAIAGGPVLPQIPFPTPMVQRVPSADERAAALFSQELDDFPNASWLRESDLEAYHAIAQLGWVLDGISGMESDPVQALIDLGLENPESAITILKMPWLNDGMSEDEAWTVVALGYLAFDAPDTFERAMDMHWIGDGISEDESWAISSLSDIGMESRDAANRLASYHWFVDGIDADEAAAVSMLGSISYETGSAARLIGMPFMGSIEPADPHVLTSLGILAYESPNVFDRILTHPSVSDGISDDETAALALLHDVQATNPDMVDTLLDSSNVEIERRHIQLQLAGDVELVIVRLQPGAARSMDLLESAVRFVEVFMGEPFQRTSSCCFTPTL